MWALIIVLLDLGSIAVIIGGFKYAEKTMKKSFKLLSRAIIAGLASGIFVFSSMASAARPVIIDTDAAIDDAIAMLYLFKRKDVDVKAITVAATGEAHCQPALQNIAGLMKMGHAYPIPVACGRDTPLEGKHKFPQWISESADSLYHMAGFLPRAKTVSSGDAVELITRTLQKSDQPVDIVALGPLTNIAEAIEKNPGLTAKIRMLYTMGGAVNVSGNVAAVESRNGNKAAEWNFYIDPKADDIVFRSGMPITLVPLDATNHVPVDKAFYQQLFASQPKTDTGKFIYKLFVRNKHDFLSKGWYFWDPLAAAIATDEGIATIETKKLRISLKPEEMSGATVIDSRYGNDVRVCVNAKADKFTRTALKTIMS